MEKLLNESEAASVLGVRPATLRRWRWSGSPALPFHRIGGAVRYAASDVAAWIETRRRTSTTEGERHV